METSIPLTGISTREHDRGSFSKLYGQYARMVHGILLARVPRSEVEDLAQEVFLNAWRTLSSLRDRNAAGGWLAMIARNQAIDYHRRTPEVTELESGVAAPERGAPGSAGGARHDQEAARSLPGNTDTAVGRRHDRS